MGEGSEGGGGDRRRGWYLELGVAFVFERDASPRMAGALLASARTTPRHNYERTWDCALPCSTLYILYTLLQTTGYAPMNSGGCGTVSTLDPGERGLSRPFV